MKISWNVSNGEYAAERVEVDLVAEMWRAVHEPEVALVEGFEHPVPPELLEQRLVVLQRNQVRDDRLVRDHEAAAVHRAVDRRLDALLEVGDQVARVAAEDLVAALAAENDLGLACGGLGDHVLRERAGAGRRVVEVVDDALDRTEEVIHADVDHTEVQVALVGDRARVATLVVALVLREAPGEGLHALSGARLASDATVLESSPPLRYAATGTSLRRCSFTDSASSASIRSSKYFAVWSKSMS